ncbi:MAG: FHA domain-containing protein [Proteobacteria bacterium]|nr:FHA domain-containing protein [Pseudomonadota bacterium]
MTSLHSESASQRSERSRLIGWLISYELDSRGAAYEIRAGRLIVGSAPAADMRTISVSERSVSSPHLAVSATPKHQVVIQDIFSEHGTYITRIGEEKEQRISGPTPLHHGDWLRIGEKMRFQVCLIDMGKKILEQ